MLASVKQRHGGISFFDYNGTNEQLAAPTFVSADGTATFMFTYAYGKADELSGEIAALNVNPER